MRILILEDNPVDADLSRRAIADAFEDCIIEIAPTIKKARELLEDERPFQLALLDMNLPDGNGLELLTEIRKSELKVAVVVFTATGNEEVAVAALKAGANDYIAKRPGYTEQLPIVIQSVLESYNQQVQQQNEAIGVLYIEHNSMDVDLTKRHLKNYAPNIELEITSSAEAALKLISVEKDIHPLNYKYKVILMDYRLQGMSALDFIKIIRQEIKVDIPIIIVTGQGDEAIATQALKLGATEYITKSDNYLFRLPSLIQSAYQQCELKHKQAELAESEAKYRLIAENAGDVIFTLDLNLNYTYVSPAIMTLRGFSPEEAMKQKIEEVLTPESYQKAIKLISEILHIDHKLSNKPIQKRLIELEMIRKDQTTVWTEVLASLIIDENNNPVGILGVTRDISKRKAALDELRKLSRAVEQSPVSILITDPNGTIEYVNPSFSEITGYTSAEIIGKNPRILKSGDTSDEAYKILWDTIASGNTWRGEFRNLKKNGEHFFESASISPIKDKNGHITHYLAVKEDITIRKLAEEQISKLNENLELKVLERTAQLQAANKEMEAFSYSVSHDLRSPLRAISGFATILTEDYNNTIDAEGKRLLNLITTNAKNMSQLIDDLLAFSRLGRKDTNFDTIDMNALVRETYDSLVTENERPLINFTLQDLPVVFGDVSMLKQVWINLISNAIKFSSHKTDRTIEIGCTTEPQSLVFYIKDNGAGFDMSYSAKLFGVFQRLHSAKEFEGTGIGLALVKQIINRHKGQIWAEGSPGKGATFFFSLPVNPD
jgi:PAS domain S-box-containing protein